MISLPDQALCLLMAHCVARPEQAPRLQRLRSWLEERASLGAELAHRRCWPAHLTVSALAWDPSLDQVLLIEHRASGLWLPPGGHLEPEDLSLTQAALRELQEETGLQPGPQAPTLLDIDSHPIAARPEKGEAAHWHHDFLFLLPLAWAEPQPQWAEVSAARWFARTQALSLGNARLRRALAAVVPVIEPFTGPA
jgi:8-oxo-dGTP pyrophosphatase MutT (NUDIX family)